MTTTEKKEFLSTRVCRLLQQRDMTSQEMAPVLEETLRRVRQSCFTLRASKHISQTREARGIYRYHLIKFPENADTIPIGARSRPIKKTDKLKAAGSGVIAPRSLAINFSTTLRRDPFEQWRLCQRDPITATQSAVFSFKR